MRLICENFAMLIKSAECEGKRLIFRDFDDVVYYTDEYFHENIAMAKLSDLVFDGYIRVKALHVKE